MNMQDRAVAIEICHLADTLMNAGETGSGITNADVVETMIGDVGLLSNGAAIRHLQALVDKDAEYIKRGKG